MTAPPKMTVHEHMYQVAQQLRQDLNREPSPTEIADAASIGQLYVITPKAVRQLIDALDPVDLSGFAPRT